MKFVAGKMGETLRQIYPDPILSATKPTWSDQDTNSGPQRLTACAKEPSDIKCNIVKLVPC